MEGIAEIRIGGSFWQQEQFAAETSHRANICLILQHNILKIERLRQWRQARCVFFCDIVWKNAIRESAW